MKETTLKLKMPENLDRAFVVNAFPLGISTKFTVLFSKQNPGLRFSIDSDSNKINNKNIDITMFRNLESSKFCQSFFSLETKEDEKFDYKNKFHGCNKQYEKNIFKYTQERIDLQMSTKADRPSNNYLLILGFKLFDLDDNLLFFFVQRRIFNSITKLNIIRTTGLQFSTKTGLIALDKYHNNFENSIKKVNGISLLNYNFDSEG